QRQRLALARALALDAPVLLLDEPFAGLDPAARAELLTDASRALRAPDRATLVVLHDRAEAWALADRLLILLDGRVAADGAPADLLDRPPTPAVAAFLGFTGELADAGGAVVRVRPAQVSILRGGPGSPGDAADAAGSGQLLDGVVEGVVPEEDGALCAVRTARGVVHGRTAHPAPRAGEAVRVVVEGGVRFAGAGGA
ncbi:MAG: hypothetical protein AAGC46_20665, partial [Solirubrobacteraceae bacterium]